jgi:16S rRNA (guanine(966)-N(2))-methyltransferase RsmD
MFKGRILKAPKGIATRPTKAIMREAVFNICQQEITGARFLDLFAGSGSMGFEAISRGAASVVFVEKNVNAFRCIRENISLLGITSQAELLATDALTSLTRLEKRGDSFTLVYIDPPYSQVQTLAPLLLEKLKTLVTPGGIVFLEGPSKGKLLEQIGQQRTFGNSVLYQITCF